MPHLDRTAEIVREQINTLGRSNTREFWQYLDLFDKLPTVVGNLEPSTVNQAAIRSLVAANPHLIGSGTNVASGSVAFSAGGGVRLTTGGTSGDEYIVGPASLNSGAIQCSGLNVADLRPDAESFFEALVSIPTITSVRVVAGLRLAAAVAENNGNDGVFFAFATGGNGAGGSGVVSTTGWRVGVRSNSGNSNSDQVVPGIPAVAADRRYLLRIAFIREGSVFRPYCSITDANATATNPPSRQGLVYALAATTFRPADAAALRPVIGVQTLTGAARTLDVRFLRCGRRHAG